MIQSYKPRLNGYLTEARRAFKEIDLSVPGDLAPDSNHHLLSLLSHLESFRVLIDDTTRLSTQDGLEESVHSAYDICHNYNEQDFENVSNKVSNAKKLRNVLGFLGRLDTCFKIFIRAAERLPGFQFLRIFPVTVLPAGKLKSIENPKHRWSLARTFSALGLSLNEQTVRKLFKTGKKKNSWTIRRLLQKFEELKSPVFQVHAEVQVLLAATRHDCTGASIFKYVGCSKRSCFLCYKFIQKYGQFDSRGCHGKLYDLWTVPEVPWLAEESSLRLVQILEDIEEKMRNYILCNHDENLLQAQESTVGGSSMATVLPYVDNPYTMSLVSHHLEGERGNIIFDISERLRPQSSK